MVEKFLNLLGVRVSPLTMEKAVSGIERFITTGTAGFVCVANVHVIMECQRDAVLRSALNRGALVTPDGMPLVWMLKLNGFRDVSRVYGPDLLLAACQYGLERGWRHFFYGGAPGVAEKLVQNLNSQFPGLCVAGVESPPFHVLTAEEDAQAVDRINASQADIVWVGLGAPKQEKWMDAHLGRIDAPVMIGVGAAFDFHAGLKKQAPRWMQRSGLEWFFRLCSEPRRLWRRYLINNPLFLLLAGLQFLGLRKYEAPLPAESTAGPGK